VAGPQAEGIEPRDLGRRAHPRVRGQHHRFGQPRDTGDPRRLPVPQTAGALGRDEDLVHRREVRRAREDLLPLGEGYQGPPQGHPAHERLRTVDRVEDPTARGIGPRRAELLAEDAILGAVLLQPGPCCLLGLAVRHRHRRAVALGLDSDAPLVVTKRHLARDPGHGLCRVHPRPCLSHHASPRTGTPAAESARFSARTVVVPS